MINQIIYNKYYHFVIATLMLIVVYYLAIDKTIHLMDECSEMEEMSGNFYEQEKFDSLKKIEDNLNSLYSKVVIDSNQNKSNIIHSISEYVRKNKVSIVDVSDEVVLNNGQFLIETNKLIIQGDFFVLLDLLDHLERNDTNGKIASAKMEKMLDYKTNKEFIYLTVYLQSISLS